MDWRKYLLAILLSVAFVAVHVSGLAVMSIDLGSEWMKVAIVSPGVPMEVALNKESKRKTPAAISFRNEERTFGDDALNVAVRFPDLSYHYLLDLLGKSIDNPVVQLYKKRFPFYNLEADPNRSTVLFKHPSGKSYSPEELVGQLLYKAQEYAQNSANQVVTEVVLTVPGFFNDFERRSLITAAELAGLKVLQLINDYSAVALNYGIFRRKEFADSAQYVMFFDMGASSTTATIVQYQTVKVKDRGIVETLPQASVIGVGFDRTLGGLEMTLRLRDYLAQKFNEMKKTDIDVTQNPRAMAKLFKEAGRVKTVLSANADHFAQIEGLLEGIDFRLKVTREEFEKLCADLFDRVKAPVEKALKMSGLTTDILNAVVLVGAGTRVPAVQDRLSAAVKRDLARNLNTDEAAVMGAVYRAADLSTGFKVQKFLVKDAVIYPIQVHFDRDGDASSKQVRRTLFGAMNPYPQKKVLTLYKHTEDFSFHVNYADLDHLDPFAVEALGSLNLTKVNLKGVPEALAKFSTEGHELKGIKAHFHMDDSGILSLPNVELVAEKTISAEEESPLSKLGSTIRSENSKDNPDVRPVTEEAEENEKENKTEQAKEKPESKEPPPADGAKKNDTEKEKKDAKDETPKKPKIVTLKEPIKAEIEDLGIPVLSGDAYKATSELIEAYNKAELEKAHQEKALNLLESAVISYKQKLQDDEFVSFANTDEVDKIKARSNELSEWLDEEGYSADTKTLTKKLDEFDTLVKPVLEKKKNHETTPEALEKLENAINKTNTFTTAIRNMTATAEGDLPPFYSETEMDGIDKLITDIQKWRDDTVEQQSKLARSDPPVLVTRTIFEKIQLIETETRILINKVKLWDQAMKAKSAQDATKNDTKKDKAGKKRSKSKQTEGEQAKSEKGTADKEAGESVPETEPQVETPAESEPEQPPQEQPEKVAEPSTPEAESSPSTPETMRVKLTSVPGDTKPSWFASSLAALAIHLTFLLL
ncbi:hypoxia up-regulated protein 1 isoform X2 [Bemisia tabaci]|uniref:hypoxia up-regulated protein 1 isoform X2 n=1 Tax=Bemisia tabaci TaxID=7038 RepID=UPI003B280139